MHLVLSHIDLLLELFLVEISPVEGLTMSMDERRVPQSSQSNGKFGQCLPLLKLDADDDRPHVCEAGLEALAGLPPPVSVVNLLGDGRCGKSTLASRLVHDSDAVFPVGDTGTAVTEGIDMCIIPRADGDGSIVILDCEGGNNPTGAIHSAVDLAAMLVTTLTVQVVWGQTSEGQLLQIGQAIASRDRLLVGDRQQQFPAQRLLLVVNGCHLQYSTDHLNKTFIECHSGAEASRNELRSNIKRAYSKIDFFTVPVEGEPTYNSRLEQFKRKVPEQCAPVCLAGSRLSGAQIAEMLKTAVSQLRAAGNVPIPSVFRHVLYDNMLQPLILRLAKDFEADLPDLSDGEFRPFLPDKRQDVYIVFDRETQQLTHGELVVEAREELRKMVEAAWTRVFKENSAIGEQNRDVSTESEMRYSHTEERVVGWKKSCWVIGKKTPQVEAATVFRLWTRTRMLKKNGTQDFSDWTPSSHSMDGASMGNWNSYTGSLTSQTWPQPHIGGSLKSDSGYMAGERQSSPSSPLIGSMKSACSMKSTDSLFSASASPDFRFTRGKPPPSPTLSNSLKAAASPRLGGISAYAKSF
jgi:GTPase SAR1 family protein